MMLSVLSKKWKGKYHGGMGFLHIAITTFPLWSPLPKILNAYQNEIPVAGLSISGICFVILNRTSIG